VATSIWERVGYTPTAAQAAVHDDPARNKCVAGGERGGKSRLVAAEALWEMDAPESLGWIVGPDYVQTQQEFEYIRADLEQLGALASCSTPDKGGWKLETLWAARVETKTSADARKIAGKAPNWILMTEAAQQTYETWLKCRGRVGETRGKVLMSGTFEGSLGWYPALWEKWQGANDDDGRSFSVPTWSNLEIYPGGREDPEILALERTFPPDLFSERFGAIPCRPFGMVFKEFEHAIHVRKVAVFDAEFPVSLAVDPGYAAPYAVLAVQEVDGLVRVVDRVYERFHGTEEMIQICKTRPWWGSVSGGVIDVAARQHHDTQSAHDIWMAEGIWLKAQPVGIVDGILRMRTILKDPATHQTRIVFAPHLDEVFNEFRSYRYKKEVEMNAISEVPLDRDNHALKALAYWLFDRYGPVERPHRASTPGVAAVSRGGVAVPNERTVRKLFDRSGKLKMYTDVPGRPRRKILGWR
jgi:hypothetical protein